MALIDGIQAYYKFDNNGDDETGNYDIVLGSNFVAGKINEAYDPSGSEGYDMGFGWDDIDDGSGNFSVSFWVKRTANNSGNQVIMRNYGAVSPNATQAGIQFPANNKIALQTDSTTTTDPTDLVLNTYTFYTWTYDGTTHKVYRDGNSTPVISDVSAFNPAAENVHLFENTASGDRLGVADIDEIGIWNKVLSTAEITELYNSGTGLSYPFVTAPVAEFSGTPLLGNRPLTVVFTDESTNTPTNWSWNFGDGNTSTDQNPTNIFGAGKFTISLTATNAGGADGETKVDYISVIDTGGIEVGTGTIGTRFIETKYPYAEGLQAGTTKQTGNPNL